jgi:hypothetical protein
MFSVKNYLLNLNFFESSDDNTDREDEHQRRSNIIATRVYLIVLVLALIIITLIFALSLQTVIVTVEHPSKLQFEILPPNAHCPCSRMSIPYGEFTSIQWTFHQVCSSDFVSDRWIEAMFSYSNSTYFYYTDFRTYGSAQFQALASFCRLSQAGVIQTTSLFYLTSLISAQVQSEAVFQLQVQASISQFQLIAPNEFVKQLKLVREMIMADGLISALQTNAMLTYPIGGIDEYYIIMWDMSYPSDNDSWCLCSVDLDCQTRSLITNIFEQSARIDMPNDTEVLMDIPGLVISCLPVNSLLSSTLECFYNQSCLSKLLSFFPTAERFTAMVASEESRFKYNSTIQTIVNHLMVEEWITNVSYDKYYAQCAPIFCTYSKLERPGFLFVLAKVIRSFGGLTVIFGLIIPIIIRFIRRPRNVESIPCKCDITEVL